MRIAIVVPEFPPNIIGGGGVVFEALSRHMQERHEVRVFSADDASRSWSLPRTHDRLDHDLDVLRYPLLPVYQNDSALRTVLPPNPRAAYDLWCDLRTWKPDVAHLHGVGYTFVDLASFILRRFGIPYLLTDHGLPGSYVVRSSLVQTGYRAYHNSVLKRTVLGAGRVTAVSTQEAQLCSQSFSTDVLTIPNGITPLPFDTRSSVDTLFAVPEGPYLAAAGRIVHHKGFDVLLDALIDNPGLPPCVIAGDWRLSEYGQALHARAGTRMKFVGPLTRQDLRSFFLHADMVVVPSRNEPFGLVGFEALSARVRVVATRTGGLFDFANEHTPVLLVESGNSQELANAIGRTVALGPITESEWTACEEMLERLNWSDIASRYEEELLLLVRS
jgi:glycosyltransferase involved in cell wall biosynthesis